MPWFIAAFVDTCVLGTFSQRHATFTDQKTDEQYTPLCHLGEDCGTFYPANSHLSEFAVLGFEVGGHRAMQCFADLCLNLYVPAYSLVTVGRARKTWSYGRLRYRRGARVPAHRTEHVA